MHSSVKIHKTFELVRKRIPYRVTLKFVTDDEMFIKADIKDLDEATLFVEAYEAVIHSRFKVTNPGTNLKTRYITNIFISC